MSAERHEIKSNAADERSVAMMIKIKHAISVARAIFDIKNNQFTITRNCAIGHGKVNNSHFDDVFFFSCIKSVSV